VGRESPAAASDGGGVVGVGVAVVPSPAEGSLGVAGVAASEAGPDVVPLFDGGAAVGFTVPDGVVGFRAPADALGTVPVELAGGAGCCEVGAGGGALGRGGGAGCGCSFLLPTARSPVVVAAGAAG
jgi:hypothetical protein